MPEAQLEESGSGLAPVTQGWFIVNVRDAEWWNSANRGARCGFENEYGDSPVEFDQIGINVTVLEPGETVLYHAESNQEAFLVLSGECTLLVEGEERRVRAWDLFHSPPWTEHGFVGAGEGPCVILMVGSRSGPEVRYPASELAARYGASVAEETSDWRQAYATIERFRRERPRNWDRLPWAPFVQSPVALDNVERGAAIELARPNQLAADVPYAYAAVADGATRLIFTAGACPLDAAGDIVARGDVVGQAEQVMANLEAALQASGAELRDVVKTTVYVATQDRDDLVAAWEVVRRHFGDHDPPATLLGVTVLGWRHQLVEVEAVAALG